MDIYLSLHFFSFLKDWTTTLLNETNKPRRGSGSFHYRYIFIRVINGHLEMDKDEKQGWRRVSFTYRLKIKRCVCLLYACAVIWLTSSALKDAEAPVQDDLWDVAWNAKEWGIKRREERHTEWWNRVRFLCILCDASVWRINVAYRTLTYVYNGL